MNKEIDFKAAKERIVITRELKEDITIVVELTKGLLVVTDLATGYSNGIFLTAGLPLMQSEARANVCAEVTRKILASNTARVVVKSPEGTTLFKEVKTVTGGVDEDSVESPTFYTEAARGRMLKVINGLNVELKEERTKEEPRALLVTTYDNGRTAAVLVIDGVAKIIVGTFAASPEDAVALAISLLNVASIHLINDMGDGLTIYGQEPLLDNIHEDDRSLKDMARRKIDLFDVPVTYADLPANDPVLAFLVNMLGGIQDLGSLPFMSTFDT